MTPKTEPDRETKRDQLANEENTNGANNDTNTANGRRPRVAVNRDRDTKTSKKDTKENRVAHHRFTEQLKRGHEVTKKGSKNTKTRTGFNWWEGPK